MHNKMDDYGKSRDGSIEAITDVVESGCAEAMRLDMRYILRRSEANETM